MKEWVVDRGAGRGRIVARARGLKVRGVPCIGSAELELQLELDVVEWDGWATNQPLDVVPVAAEVSVARGTDLAKLGTAPARPGLRFRPPSHSDSQTVAFALPFASKQVEALEDFRNGEPLRLELTAHAMFYVAGAFAGRGRLVETFTVSRDDWSAVLQAIGYSKHVTVDVPIPSATPAGLAEASARLEDALAARQDGRHGDAVAKARVAIEAIEKAGFGGKAPSDVVTFIKENAKRLSMTERYAAVQAALELFLSPAHHAGTDPDDYTRADSTFAVGVSAAILSLAPRYAPAPTK